MVDEVITGFGRLGSWFGFQPFGITPDLVPMAKGLSSGYLPIRSAFRDIVKVLREKGGEFVHGYTYSGHPVACAVASANLGLIEQEGLVPRTRDDTGPYLASKWRELAGHPLVGEARSIGLIGTLSWCGTRRPAGSSTSAARWGGSAGISASRTGSSCERCATR